MEPTDEDNVIAALEHRDRVNVVRLFVTGLQMGKIAAVMQEPFPALTHLSMRSEDEDIPVLTAEFLGGVAPRLQEITLYRIPFPALPTLLLSTGDLVTLNLFDIPDFGYISPERMIPCLAALPRLEVFAITHKDFDSRPDPIRPPPVTRLVLPALISLSFKGLFEYLEDLAGHIDGPQLEQISTIYVDVSDHIEVTQLSEFIDRSIGPSTFAYIHFHFPQVVFTMSREYENSAGRDRRSVATTISHAPEMVDWKLFDLVYLLREISAAFCTVVHLELEAELAETDSSDDDVRDIGWLSLLHQFPAMQTLYVSPGLAGVISLALKDITVEMAAEMFPSLRLICLEGEPASSLEQIVAIRRFSDHPITVVETKDEFGERLESCVSR